MFTRIRTAWKARTDPIVATRELDYAAGLTWLCYALWGLFSALSDLTVFQTYQQWEQAYPTIWGGTLGLMALAAAVSCFGTFFIWHTNIPGRVRAKRFERFALWAVLGLTLVYPITLLLQGDSNGNIRWDILFLSLSFFPFMVFRIRHLKNRIAQLFVIAAATNATGKQGET